MALLVLAACGDPGGACAQGETRVGQTCVVAELALAIDGATDDWPDAGAPTCAACTAGQVARIRGGHSGDRAALLLELAGSPDRAHAYHISLYPPIGPGVGIVLHVSASGVIADLGGTQFTGIPVEHAFGAQAIELAIPTAALPCNGGFDTTAGLDGQNAMPFAALCYDAASPICRTL